MKVEPLSDYLLVRPIDKQEKLSKMGLILLAVGKEDANLGEILSVGPGRKDENGKLVDRDPRIKQGQKIIFTPQYGHDFNLDGERLFIIPEHSVYGCVQE